MCLVDRKFIVPPCPSTVAKSVMHADALYADCKQTICIALPTTVRHCIYSRKHTQHFSSSLPSVAVDASCVGVFYSIISVSFT